jgi:hypothetical protein
LFFPINTDSTFNFRLKRDSAINFAVLLIARLRFRIWIEYSLTVFARTQLPQPARIAKRAVWVT